eukprot:Nk52_evm30s2192 gene=Nk52_evmTU30s2192
MGSKREAESVSQSDAMVITPLGAGQEVGRSCHIIEYKGKTIMLDCGIHPGRSGLAALPYFDEIDPASIDLLLVTHFHLDHIASLPYFLEKTTFKGRVFMTHPTKAIYKWMLSDYVKVSTISVDDNLFDERDLDKSMDKIETMNFHQHVEVDGVRFWAYHAGHVLGAAMFMIEIAGVRILYTGDYSREEDRHLMAAELPTLTPDVLIMEATYGVQLHEPQLEREARFTGSVHEIVNRGGRCLIPVFALGRAQELLLILDEYWEEHPELHNIPIYYASSLAKKCIAIYQTYINMMNEKIRRQFAVSNPFVFKHISNLKSIEHFDDIGPSVVMASPGMLQPGLSRELFEMWCPDKKNGVIIAGYSVDGTLAKQILSEPKEITSLMGNKLPLNMSVTYVSFSAHVDFAQSSDFVDKLRPHNIVLVHGDANEMMRLKGALVRKYENHTDYSINIYTPKNTQGVEFMFRGEKIVKAVGTLAKVKPEVGLKVSGVLVKRGFEHHLLNPSDLAEYSGLTVSHVTERQCIGYSAPFSLLIYFLELMFGTVKRLKVEGMPGVSKGDEQSILVMEVVTIKTKGEYSVTVEWTANSVNDMIADSVMAVVLQVESNPEAVKLSSTTCTHGHKSKAASENEEKKIKELKEVDSLIRLFCKQFVDVTMIAKAKGRRKRKERSAHEVLEEDPALLDSFDQVKVVLEDKEALVDLDTWTVEGENEDFRQRIASICSRATISLLRT